jgi:hypothetical protein
MYVLRGNRRLQDRRKKIIKNTQKNRESDGHPDHDARKTDRFLPRRPINVAQLGPRFRKKFFNALEHADKLLVSYSKKRQKPQVALASLS